MLSYRSLHSQRLPVFQIRIKGKKNLRCLEKKKERKEKDTRELFEYIRVFVLLQRIVFA
jgi:hypothetical protein